MIEGKGNEAACKLMMQNAVFRLFRNKGIDLFHGYKLYNGKVADLYAVKCDEYGVIEETVVVETKQAVEDFYSTHGFNFIGLRNYIAVPSELVGRAIVFLREELQNVHIGVIEVDTCGNAQIIMESRYFWKNLWKPFPEISGYRVAVELAETYDVELWRIFAAIGHNMISSKKDRRGLTYIKEADLVKCLPTDKAYKERILMKYEELFSGGHPFENYTLKEIEKVMRCEVEIRRKDAMYL